MTLVSKTSSALAGFRSLVAVLLAALFFLAASAQADEKPAGATSPSLQSLDWTLMTNSPGWQGRGEAAMEFYDGKLWMMGGYCDAFQTDVRNDVWNSVDGINWTKVTDHAPWVPRLGLVSAVFDGKLWIMGGTAGGFAGYEKYNDVWYTTDGLNWTQSADAGWSARTSARSLVFGGKIWVFGGYSDRLVFEHDVWSSTNGVNWTNVGTAPWSGRAAMGVTVFNGKMWIVGGAQAVTRSNDVWSSTNGSSWTLAQGNAPWEARAQQSVVVYNNSMWILGGNKWSNGLVNMSDVWISENGTNWFQESPSTPWGRLSCQQAMNFNNRIFIWGGYVESGPPTAKVWASPVLQFPNAADELWRGYR